MPLFFKQLTSFTIMGAISTAVHFTLLIIAVQFFHLQPVLGSAAGCIAGGITNYLLNYHFTFQSDKRHLEASLRFFVVALTGLALNTLIMYVAVQWLHYLMSQAIATTIVLFWNFLCNRCWTFKEESLVKQ